MKYELIVIGGGPGGFDCAVHAAGTGLKTALIERDKLGGTCLNVGCIPTKLMLGATSAIEELHAQVKMKVASGGIDVDWAALQTRKDRFITGTRKAMMQKLDTLGVTFYQARAGVMEPGRVEAASDLSSIPLEYDKLVLATGSHPTAFPGLEPDGKGVLDSTDFLALDEMPDSLIVIGAGFIGLEMAQAAHRMGAKVTIVDALDRVASYEDPEVSKALQSIFKRWKWDVRLGVKVESVATVDGKAVLTLEGGDTVEAGKALVAVGRRPNSANMNLETLGVATAGPGYLQTDEHLRAADNVFAVGDVNGRFMLAHAAEHQGRYVADFIAGKTTQPYESGQVPSVLYGSPEVMRVGRMAHELEADGIECETTKAPLAANAMAQAHAATQGFVKVVWSGDRMQGGKVAGITAVGHDVSRLITTATIMVQQHWTREDAQKLMFAHPTLDESLKAALEG